MDVSRVRQELANAAATITGLRCFGYVPDSVSPPCFFPAEVDIEPNQTFSGSDKAFVTCRVLVSRADDRSGQKLLDELLSRTGSKSVRAALIAARGLPGQLALNGAADDLSIERIQGYRQYQVGSAEETYFGAEIIVKVIGS